MREREEPVQLELGLELWVSEAPPRWEAAIEHETEGNQDTGWWDA